MKQRGFTLIELMIVVTVVGIIAAIAYPSYAEAVLKGRRAQARTAILELLQQQERYMTQNNSYVAFSTNAETGVATPSVPFKVYAGDSAAEPPYFLSAERCSQSLPINECVRVLAVPVRADAAVGTLSATSTGERACSGGAPRKTCWP
jgi:type IV pilus assembly protein PilE